MIINVALFIRKYIKFIFFEIKNNDNPSRLYFFENSDIKTCYRIFESYTPSLDLIYHFWYWKQSSNSYVFFFVNQTFKLFWFLNGSVSKIIACILCFIDIVTFLHVRYKLFVKRFSIFWTGKFFIFQNRLNCKNF